MTNDAVRGYIIITLKNLGYKIEEIEKILDELYYVFDLTSESEAERYYYSIKLQKN